MNLERRSIALKYNSIFIKSELLDIWNVRDESECAWHLYPVKLNLKALNISRNDFIAEMKNRNIGTSVHYIPMYRFTAFKNSGYTINDFPGCEDIFSREVSLPIFPGMSGEESDYVIENVMEVLERNRR
jgi:perosamine synthetase